MTLPWRNPADSIEQSGGDSELSLIPRWSILLAVVVFIATQYLFHHVMPHSRQEMLPMRLIMGYSPPVPPSRATFFWSGMLAATFVAARCQQACGCCL